KHSIPSDSSFVLAACAAIPVVNTATVSQRLVPITSASSKPRLRLLYRDSRQPAVNSENAAGKGLRNPAKRNANHKPCELLLRSQLDVLENHPLALVNRDLNG